MASTRATITDVAELAGVSIKTVSRVVNAEPNVRPMTRMRVERAIAQLDYRPNISARDLASPKARLVILVYDDPSQYDVPSSGYVLLLQEGALRACKQVGFELLVHPCSYKDEGVHEELRRVIGRARPAGVVLAAPLSNMQAIVDTIRATGVPCIPLARGTTGRNDFMIGTNDRTSSADMVKHLVQLGHRKIAFIEGNPDHRAVGNRLNGYLEGLKTAGLDYRDVYIQQGDNSIESGEEAASRLLELNDRPTAIFAANDDMAAGVVREANRRGLRIPEQLSVAGFDDVSLARLIYPSLTTVYQPLREMAEAATMTLAKGGDIEKGIMIVPGDLRIRESTGPAPR